MPESLPDALTELRDLLLDPQQLVRAVGAGRQRAAQPSWRRCELRPVELREGRRLQVVRYDARQAYTANFSYGEPAASAVEELLAEPFGNWHVETLAGTVQLRVTKRGAAQVHRGAPAGGATTAPEPAGEEPESRVSSVHDRVKPRLLDPGDGIFRVVGGGAAKRRQVDAFLRVLEPVLEPLLAPLADGRHLDVVDLGCGNAYLTFGLYRYLTGSRGHAVELVGVDVRPEARQHNTRLARELGWEDHVRFVEGTILDAPAQRADVVLALHACDTATDEALARAVRWQAPVVLAAPCCHHEIQAQLRSRQPPPPYGLLTRHGILRERFADTLTDALRAALLRLLGYRVDVVEFVDVGATPRNVLLRAVYTGAPATSDQVQDYLALTTGWGVRPALERLLADELSAVLPS